jgi:hypothetical protein
MTAIYLHPVLVNQNISIRFHFDILLSKHLPNSFAQLTEKREEERRKSCWGCGGSGEEKE